MVKDALADTTAEVAHTNEGHDASVQEAAASALADLAHGDEEMQDVIIDEVRRASCPALSSQLYPLPPRPYSASFMTLASTPTSQAPTVLTSGARPSHIAGRRRAAAGARARLVGVGHEW